MCSVCLARCVCVCVCVCVRVAHGHPRGRARLARARVVQPYVCVCLYLCACVYGDHMCAFSFVDTYLHTPQLQTGHVSNCSPTHMQARVAHPTRPPHATSTTTGISQAESWHRERAEARESASHTRVRVIALVRSASSDTTEVKGARARMQPGASRAQARMRFFRAVLARISRARFRRCTRRRRRPWRSR